MHDARRWKHVFGGAMRQAGIVAAGGLFAIEQNIPRMSEDHRNAARLAEGLAVIPGIRLDPPPETNIVFFDVAETGMTGEAAKTALEAGGVRASGAFGTRLRMVTHLDVSSADIDTALVVARRVFGNAEKRDKASMPFFNRADPEVKAEADRRRDDVARQATENRASEVQRQQSDLIELARGGIPIEATKRLREIGRGEDESSLFSSDLAPEEAGLLRREGYRVRDS